MSIFENFETNTDKENNGVKIEFGTNSDGSTASVIIRRAGNSNKRYAKALEKYSRPYRRQLQLGTVSDETSENILHKVYADSVVATWEHIQDKSGIEIPFNMENAVSLFEKLPEFFNEVQKQAGSVAMFRNDALEEEAKN